MRQHIITFFLLIFSFLPLDLRPSERVVRRSTAVLLNGFQEIPSGYVASMPRQRDATLYKAAHAFPELPEITVYYPAYCQSNYDFHTDQPCFWREYVYDLLPQKTPEH